MMSKTDLFVKLSKLVIVKMIKINHNYVNLTIGMKNSFFLRIDNPKLKIVENEQNCLHPG